MEKEICERKSFVIYEQSPIKSTMLRIKLRNTLRKTRKEENKKSYNMERNYCFTFTKK